MPAPSAKESSLSDLASVNEGKTETKEQKEGDDEKASSDESNAASGVDLVTAQPRYATTRIVPQSPTHVRRSNTPKPLQPSPKIVRRSITPRPVSLSPVLSRRSITPKASTTSHKTAQPNSSQRLDDEPDHETQSHDGSIRDSRSPVVYTPKEREEQDRLVASRSHAANASSDESSSSESEEDVEMPDVKSQSSPKDNIIMANQQADVEMNDALSYSRLSSPSSMSASGSEDDLPVPKLTSTLKSSTRTSKSAQVPSSISLRSTLFHRLVSPSNTSSNASPASSIRTNDTQDEVDHQLISSVYEASSPAARQPLTQPTPLHSVNRIEKANKSSPVLRPPPIQFGSSLSMMNAKKVVPGSSLSLNGAVRSSTGKPLLKSTGRDDSEDESSESDADDSEPELPSTSLARPSQVRPVENDKKPQEKMDNSSTDDDSGSENGSGSESQSDSDSDDSEDDESEEESEAAKIRKDLMAEVAKLQASQGSSQMSRGRKQR